MNSMQTLAGLHRDRYAGLLTPATYEQIEGFWPTMLEEDQAACREAGYEPREAVWRMAMPAMQKFSFVAGGRVGAMFGVCARPRVHHLAEAGARTPEGWLWCFVGHSVGLAPNAWVEKFKFAVNELVKHYDCLRAYIGVQQLQMLRLAKFVGGELEGPEPFGSKSTLFWKYTVRG